MATSNNEGQTEEKSKLITSNTNTPNGSPLNTSEKTNKSFIFSTTRKQEFWIIYTQFIWITMQMLFEIVPGIFQMQLLGNLNNGTYYLSAVGLGRTFANVIGRFATMNLQQS